MTLRSGSSLNREKSASRNGSRPGEWGFPGWHIECTAMIFKLLGKQIDIHMGGIDLAPIHHNNEIAQAEAATGKKFVKYWMHNAFITIENKKVSKSLGNTIYLHQIIDRGYSPRALRYWYLTGHYRSPMNFTWEGIEGASQALSRLTRAFLELPQGGAADEAFIKEFYAALADDLDTPRGLARVWDMVKDANVPPAKKRASLLVADRIFGLGLADARPSAQIKVVEQSDLPQEIQDMVSAREAARREKDFAKADELRKQIEAAGYDIKDTADGSDITKR